MFSSPDKMWEACCEYFDWVDENPMKAEKLFSFQGSVIKGEYSIIRAMTIAGLCNFLGVTSRMWRGYREKEGFVPVMERVEQVMYAQKFEGASADLLNANIIARDLGLADKSELTGADGGAIEMRDVTPERRKAAIATILARKAKD
jgi:hypothetical protein